MRAMKLKKTIISLIVSFCAILTLSLPISATSTKSDEELYELSVLANNVNEELVTALESSNLNRSNANVEYAGSYIDNEGGLHFQYKSDSNVNLALSNYSTENNLGNDELQIYYENAKYSNEEILKAEEILLKSELALSHTIILIEIDYTINGIRVSYDGSKANNGTITNALNQILDNFNNYKLEVMTEIPTPIEEVAIAAGERLRPRGCSSAFAAKDNDGNKGFLTAAHCGWEGQTITNTYGEVLGEMTAWEKSPTIDATFVKTRASVTIIKKGIAVTPPMASKTYSSFSYVLPVQGSKMIFYGEKNTFESTILSNSASYTIPNWSKMLKYEKKTEPGDSGGMVLIGNTAYGVHRGGTDDIEINKASYATPSMTIFLRLGLTN